MLKRYKDWSPTEFDVRGLGITDSRGEWLVAPCMRTRDSGALEASNFEVMLDRLEGESEDVEVHRFNHWGVGWLEVVLVKPDTDAAVEAECVRESLEDYGCLDEMHYSQKQVEMGEDA